MTVKMKTIFQAIIMKLTKKKIMNNNSHTLFK